MFVGQPQQKQTLESKRDSPVVGKQNLINTPLMDRKSNYITTSTC